MQQIQVQKILPMMIYFGPKSQQNGRFAEVLPMDGNNQPPGTRAVFHDSTGLRICGVVADWRMQGDNVDWRSPGTQVIDTKA